MRTVAQPEVIGYPTGHKLYEKQRTYVPENGFVGKTQEPSGSCCSIAFFAKLLNRKELTP